jgi:hypothetical protein
MRSMLFDGQLLSSHITSAQRPSAPLPAAVVGVRKRLRPLNVCDFRVLLKFADLTAHKKLWIYNITIDELF